MNAQARTFVSNPIWLSGFATKAPEKDRCAGAEASRSRHELGAYSFPLQEENCPKSLEMRSPRRIQRYRNIRSSNTLFDLLEHCFKPMKILREKLAGDVYRERPRVLLFLDPNLGNTRPRDGQREENGHGPAPNTTDK
jgi:hypothetical protein